MLLLVGLTLLAVAIITLLYADYHVKSVGLRYAVPVKTLPETPVAIVLGALVRPNGAQSGVLRDRVECAVRLYQQHKVGKLLMSGDHGTDEYDEVNQMARYALSRGVPEQDIFLDHAGFTTYDTMYRARDVFKIKRAVIVTQAFHMPRAVYIARSLGIEAFGVKSDLLTFTNSSLELREVGARWKAFAQVNLHSRPAFLGPAIPITGDGRKTQDRPL